MAPHACSSAAQHIAGNPVGGGITPTETSGTVGLSPTSHRASVEDADGEGDFIPPTTGCGASEHSPEFAARSQRAPHAVSSAQLGSGETAVLEDLQRREQKHAPSSEGSRDLAKTKLCFDFRRGRCKTSDCNFAHGRSELRLVEGVHKTSLCRWWVAGKCRADESCRYAHGEEDLRLASVPCSRAKAVHSRDFQADKVKGPARPHPSGGDAVLRVKGTFLEVAPVDAGLPLMKRLTRTWSDEGPGRGTQRTMYSGKPDEACDNGISTRTGSSFSSCSAGFVSDVPMFCANSNAEELC